MNSLAIQTYDLGRETDNEERPAAASAEALVAQAIEAQERGDWPSALSRWTHARQSYPETAVCWAAEAALLQIVERWDDARALINDGLEQFPESVDVIAQSIGIDAHAENWDQVIKQVKRLKSIATEHPYVLENSDSLLSNARAALSAMADEALVARAQAADATQDWESSALLWGQLKDRDPMHRAFALGYGRALRESQNLEEAQKFLSDAVTLFPEDAELAAHHAEVAYSQEKWEEAAARWSAILRKFPDLTMLHALAVVSFAAAGHFSRAEELMGNLVTESPESVELRIRHAMLSDRQGQWSLSVERWDKALHLCPDDPNIRNARGDAIWQWQATKLEEGVIVANGRQSDTEDPESSKDLALRFEGLGDHCEFGTVQRRLGADPLGLFRFAAISAEMLTELLEDRLSALGDPAYVELGLTEHDEYLVRDTRGFFHMHCFVRRGSVDEQRFLKQQITRMSYLKRKLLEDLEEGSKIFVHKASLARISDDVAIALHDAIERFADNTLLVIRRSDDTNPPGTVAVLRERLLVGYIDSPYAETFKEVDHTSWEMVLRQADKLNRISLADNSIVKREAEKNEEKTTEVVKDFVVEPLVEQKRLFRSRGLFFRGRSGI